MSDTCSVFEEEGLSSKEDSLRSKADMIENPRKARGEIDSLLGEVNAQHLRSPALSRMDLINKIEELEHLR